MSKESHRTSPAPGVQIYHVKCYLKLDIGVVIIPIVTSLLLEYSDALDSVGGDSMGGIFDRDQ